MNSHLAPLGWIVVALVTGLGAAEAPSPAAPEAPRDTRSEIEALLRGRDVLPTLPPDLVDPFSRPEERARARQPAVSADPAQLAAATDQDLLNRLGASVQVRGFVEAAGHPAIIINRKAYEVGDTLALTLGATRVEVKVKRINGGTFTLGYREAELTLRLPR